MNCADYSGHLVAAFIFGAIAATVILAPIFIWLKGYRPGLNT